MPSLRILYDTDGWAHHHRAEALQRRAPYDYDVTLASWTDEQGDDPDLGDTPLDVVFCLRSSRLASLRAALDRRGWPAAVVGAWTTGWPLRIAEFHDAYAACDLLIVNNRDAWVRMGGLPGTILVPNGVDETIFTVQRPIAERSPRVLWTGSLLHSAAKGYQSRVIPLMERLREAGVATESLLVDSYGDERRTPSEMAQWYNEGTVLVCASELEGTPNPCLEAASCGCTLVSTPVGNMPELIRDGVNGYLVEASVDGLYEGVRKALSNYPLLAEQMQEDIARWFYRSRAREFYDAFDQALKVPRNGKRRRQPAANQVDLRDEVTIFVTTVGAPSYTACMQHLGLQDSRFGSDVIKHVAPMSAAFQAMIDRCATPYYVQVDEDMLLYPHAIRQLHGWMSEADPDVAICTAPLLDAHLRKLIQGVKIFRHEIVRDFPHRDVQASESDQVRRLKTAGFKHLAAPLEYATGIGPLGLHGTHWTPRSIFERYATLERKRRSAPDNRRWVATLPEMFLGRYIEARQALTAMENGQTPESTRLRFERLAELELYALLGCLAGSLPESAGEKDFRRYDRMPGFEEARRMVELWKKRDADSLDGEERSA